VPAAPTLTVRLAGLDDLDLVSSDGYLPLDVVRRKVLNHDVFVAVTEGEAIGFLRLEYLWSRIPYIAVIRVEEPNRRQGAGKALLAHVAGVLKEQGHAALYSSSQVDEATPQEWHRHMGFLECGVLNGINEGGVGEVFFRKQL